MHFPKDDWAQDAPESQGVDSAKLAEAMAYLDAQAPGHEGSRQTLVIRNGVMIWTGPETAKVSQVWSCTKSYTSTVLGLLIDEGRCSLETRACEHVPALREMYSEVTLRHLVTMTSGYDGVGGTYSDGDGSRTPFVPDKPVFAPGTRYAYWDDAMNLLGLVLTKIAGEPLADYFRRKAADAIGMKDWRWGVLETVDGVAVNGASGNWEVGLHLPARELARLGHLFLNYGVWDGKRVVSAGWVGQATSAQVPVNIGYDTRRGDGRGIYGLGWWVNGVRADGRRPLPHAPPSTFWASGLNNNRILVIPEWGMVIARTSVSGASPPTLEAMWDGVLERIGEAV